MKEKMATKVKKSYEKGRWVVNVEFDDMDRLAFICTVNDCRNEIRNANISDVYLVFSKFNTDKIEPFYVVLLSCLIDYLYRNKVKQVYFRGGESLKNFLFNELEISKRIRELTSDITPLEDGKFALWRVKEQEITEYTERIGKFLERDLNDDYLVIVKVSIQEMYYNIYDHANAGGTAFSYVYYDKKNNYLHVAVCDFGVGIARSMSETGKYSGNDEALIEKAMEKGVSAHSTVRNLGMGLNTLASMIGEKDTLRVISNNGMCYVKGGVKKKFPLHFDFKGTFIYFDLLLPNVAVCETKKYKFGDYEDCFFI